jgi:hypothetical protein
MKQIHRRSFGSIVKRVFPLLFAFLLIMILNPGIVRSEPIPSGIKPDEPVPSQSTSGPVPPLSVSSPALAPHATTTAVLIDGVPAYYWRHGCGPTAAGMVIGYYDLHDYPWLIPGDSSVQTDNVNEAIASQNTPSAISNHYEDYSKPEDDFPALYPDRSAAPVGDEHTSNSIADFMFTSFSSQNNRYGWSWSNHVGPALVNYVQMMKPAATVNYTNRGWSGSLWSQYQTEINANRPVVFLVDSSGDGSTDHFITGIGYDEIGGKKYYAAWDTWYSTIRWQEFVQMQSGTNWGIYGMTALTISYTNPTPGFDGLQPYFTQTGTESLGIQLTGTDFIETSVVRWNGVDLDTQYISPTRLNAVIPASSLATPGSATITIFTATPGGGSSPGRTFSVYDASAFTHLVFLPISAK